MEADQDNSMLQIMELEMDHNGPTTRAGRKGKASVLTETKGMTNFGDQSSHLASKHKFFESGISKGETNAAVMDNSHFKLSDADNAEINPE